jgi:hypothetical protein
MRTTITVDADVEQLLRVAMQQSGQSLKTTLNQAVRRGLAGTIVGEAQPPFRVEPQPMGLRAGIDPARLQELGDELDVQAFLDLGRRLMPAAKKP